MTAQHTPGPWRRPHGSVGIWSAADERIAVAETLRDPCRQGFRTYETVANGDLIAAAPELLAACKALKAHFHPYGPPGEALGKIYVMACAAVHKAES